MSNAKFAAVILKCVGSESRSIVRNKFLRITKPTKHIFLEELDDFVCISLPNRLCLHPFRARIHEGDKVLVTMFSTSCVWSHDIYGPYSQFFFLNSRSKWS
uniref:Uncharacterized protein n=1 Tax=Cacopsylla melanoneura TaxID=428564 RepID=A0A8D8U1L4_9HEMI